MSADRSGVRTLLRPDVWARREYEAPEPVAAFAARHGFAAADVLKLDQNENPFGCSPRVREALARCDEYHIYPDPIARECRSALAGYTGAPGERIVAGNGSDETIEVLFRLFLSPGDRVLSFPPTFGYYATVAGTCWAEVVPCARTRDWAVDVDQALARIDDRVKLVVAASPNNPTGNLMPPADLARLADTGRLLIVDEAYFEFAGSTALELALSRDNVVVLRTFSKWAGLAGVRAGYGILPAWLVPEYMKFKPPYGMSVPAMVALLASLDDREYLLGTVAVLRAERDRLLAALPAVGYLRPYPSVANFILCELTRGTAAGLRGALERRGILVRTYSDPRLAKSIRFSVGRPEQNDRLLAALIAIRSEL